MSTTLVVRTHKLFLLIKMLIQSESSRARTQTHTHKADKREHDLTVKHSQFKFFTRTSDYRELHEIWRYVDLFMRVLVLHAHARGAIIGHYLFLSPSLYTYRLVRTVFIITFFRATIYALYLTFSNPFLIEYRIL